METQEQKTQVADTIRQQIGGKALYMIGAKNFTTSGQDLTFRIMGNVAGVTHVKITLNGMDLYDVEFLKCRGGKNPSIKTVAEFNGAYADMLKGLIRDTTKLNTSL